MAKWPALLAAVLGLLICPTATADPGVPDLGSFAAAEINVFATYYNYPATDGVQFLTPGGYRCRITYTWKSNPPLKEADCWGSLPGTSFNFAGVREYLDGESTLADVDLARMEEYHPPPPHVTPPQTVNPDAYKPLPAGSKLTYPRSATCAVADAMTVCVLGDHGFVLKPEGSQAF
jgi:hypothetical protein